MASASLTGVYLHESVVRGHHIYKRVRSPIIGEVLELLREEENEHVVSCQPVAPPARD